MLSLAVRIQAGLRGALERPTPHRRQHRRINVLRRQRCRSSAAALSGNAENAAELYPRLCATPEFLRRDFAARRKPVECRALFRRDLRAPDNDARNCFRACPPRSRRTDGPLFCLRRRMSRDRESRVPPATEHAPPHPGKESFGTWASREKNEPRRLGVFVRLLDSEHSASNMEIALRIRNLNSSFAQFFFDREIEIALEAAGAMAHLAAPHDQLEIDRACAELFQKNARRGIVEDVRITSPGGDERAAHLPDVAAIGG